jgi:hypothetical protein
MVDIAVYPGSTVANTPSHALAESGRTPTFNGFHALRVAKVAKNNFSYAHKISFWK